MLLYFLRSVCTIQSDAINFQPFLPSFAIFHAFNDLFWELNDLKIEKHYKWSQKVLKIDDVALIGAYGRPKKSGVVISLKKWSAHVTDEFSFETLILRKRLSSLYTKCIQFLP